MVLDNNCSRDKQNEKQRAVHGGILSPDLTHSPRAQLGAQPGKFLWKQSQIGAWEATATKMAPALKKSVEIN